MEKSVTLGVENMSGRQGGGGEEVEKNIKKLKSPGSE